MIGNDDFYCECNDGYVPKEGEVKKNKGECTSGCDDNFCKDGSTCKPQGKDYKCICPPFFEGKNCTKASCANNPCKNDGKCEVKEIAGVTAGRCTCKAPFDGDTCETNSWCTDNICGTKKEAKCDFSVDFGAGYCKCENETLRFNYASQVCEEKPVCSYMTCQENEVCDPNEKKCVCKKGYEIDGESKKCKSKLCDKTCFPESKCSEIGNDAIKCSCNSSQYYLNNECKDASCLFQSLRSSCQRECPYSNMIREGGICKPVKSDEAKTIIPCGLSCGPYGYCFKEDKEGAEERCVCEPEAEQKDDKSACELKESVCPSNIKLTQDKTKCSCTGKYKESANKITCELKTCSDKDVQDECKKQNAVCEMDWKNGGGYDCKCKDGYYQDPKSKICLYKTNVLNLKVECSKDNKVAFMDKNGEIVCMCPPGMKSASSKPCTEKYNDKTTYLIKNLPISKAKYVHGSVVDVFALTKDVISAMENTFKDLEFARLYKYNFKDDVINCLIWLQFNKPSEFDYKRIPVAAFDDGLLLPGLQLKADKIKEVKGEELNFCSGQEHDPFCGATTCDKTECKCPAGYKVVDSSIRKYGAVTLFNCEDVNECNDGSHTCPQETTSCVNTEGSFYCKCLQNYKLKKDKVEDKNQEGCIDACKDPNPCSDGQCSLTSGGMVDCSCKVGYSGSYCNKKDVALAGAHKKTVVVGAVLGTILGVLILAVIVYVVKQRKNSHSEDFSPAPRLDNAEMTERRPMRGISNRAYQ
ncbi:adhesive plaque matrix protein 2 [Parasteatoda tepidariorum]|uniref:adhesive plaque matrix protein 2 n=1 Tax=Parasteatoda tepidariorum TaxID=114398 RepID=UPI0039BD6C0B